MVLSTALVWIEYSGYHKLNGGLVKKFEIKYKSDY